MTLDVKDAVLIKTETLAGAEPGLQPLRTTETVGQYVADPEIDRPFRFFAKPLDVSKDYRMISTSMVREIRFAEGVYRFRTLNSWYELRPLQ